MEFGLTEEDFNYIINKIKEFKEIDKAVIFGSIAKDNYKKASDVDIAIYGNDINIDIVSRLHTELEELSPMPYMFDIVSFNDIDNEEFKEHIKRVGKIIYMK